MLYTVPCPAPSPVYQHQNPGRIYLGKKKIELHSVNPQLTRALGTRHVSTITSYLLVAPKSLAPKEGTLQRLLYTCPWGLLPSSFLCLVNHQYRVTKLGKRFDGIATPSGQEVGAGVSVLSQVSSSVVVQNSIATDLAYIYIHRRLYMYTRCDTSFAVSAGYRSSFILGLSRPYLYTDI